MSGAARKLTTGLTGLSVARNPHVTLGTIYDKILRVTKKMPENAAYRKNTEAIVKARLHHVQTETDVGRLEDKINCGQIEEVIMQGQRELQLARNMLVWKPWEPLIAEPTADQWKWPIA